MSDVLAARLAEVEDAASFLAFVRALREDRLRAVAAPATGQWAHDTIEDFLDGALAWADDSDFGARQGLAGANPWRCAATFLLCGSLYE
ncbi:hypothetical protein TUM18999_23520 [Pseudomonas tohonis]|uniref:Uncharacterized protein n=1 Tax=Pseudomonas tohonis TaxID=2725477 RepID=A0A6J4E6P8_9PSED|nr:MULTISPECIES: hypothetical protein [Pseudomonas]BBP82620.1 hypothetical protein PHLH8_22620 [Pseudomonas sp. Pc102]BCG24161.1 hypothetical protein TUM18999_23520 [Pseudomonas tohonis]GJN55696.1 hypothetical protein TUM20286_54480 [Pseudomonas tohonis]